MILTKTQIISTCVFLMAALLFLSGCEDPRKMMVGDRAVIADPEIPVLGMEVRATFDQQKIALNFKWESSKEFAGQFHDLVVFDGNKWNRLPGKERINEDRLTLMMEDPRKPIKGFENVGCYIACHADLRNMPEATSDETSHYVLADSKEGVNSFALDMWHWRGGRSGPMGFAEDTFVSMGGYATEYNGRQRDDLGTPPTNWVRARGDRLRENQPLSAGRWKDMDLPRFVFNPKKVTFRNYFLADSQGNLIKSKKELTTIESLDYIPIKVVYQDYNFDRQDKVNAIDTLYLLHLAGAAERPKYNPLWEPFWSKQLGVSNAQEASAMLDDIIQKMKPGAMITRSVGFIYDSSQHDISSKREFDYKNNIWSVTLYRDLRTGTELTDDVDLSGLLKGAVYNLAFAVHDITADRLWHHISFPSKLGNKESKAEIKAHPVDNVSVVNWAGIEPFKTAVYLPGKVSLQHLTSPGKHQAGASFLMQLRCMNCHTVDDIQGVANRSKKYYVAP